jgi:hypothetical protein
MWPDLSTYPAYLSVLQYGQFKRFSIPITKSNSAGRRIKPHLFVCLHSFAFPHHNYYATPLSFSHGSSDGIVTTCWTVRGPSPSGATFFTHAQTSPGALPASCTMDTVSSPGVTQQAHGADHPLLLARRLKMRKVIPPPPLRPGPWWPVIG